MTEPIWPEKKGKPGDAIPVINSRTEFWPIESEGYIRGYNAAIDACKLAWEKTPKDLTNAQLRFDIERKNNEIEKLYGIIHELEKSPKLVELDERTIRLIMDLGRMTERPGDARDIQRIIALWEWPIEVKEEMLTLIGLHDSRGEAIGKVIKFMCSKFGTPKPRPVVAVEEITNILESTKMLYGGYLKRNRCEVLAQAIVKHLKEGK